jgi:hypothetical protein
VESGHSGLTSPLHFVTMPILGVISSQYISPKDTRVVAKNSHTTAHGVVLAVPSVLRHLNTYRNSARILITPVIERNSHKIKGIGASCVTSTPDSTFGQNYYCSFLKDSTFDPGLTPI